MSIQSNLHIKQNPLLKDHLARSRKTFSLFAVNFTFGKVPLNYLSARKLFDSHFLEEKNDWLID